MLYRSNAGRTYGRRYGWKLVIIRMIALTTVGCLGFVGLKNYVDWWFVIGICYGIMLGGYWSAYHLLELWLIRDVVLHRRGESSAVITYINGVENAVGIGLFTILLQFLPLQTIKVIIVIPILLQQVLYVRICYIKLLEKLKQKSVFFRKRKS